MKMKKDSLIVLYCWIALNICSYISMSLANKSLFITDFGDSSCMFIGVAMFVTAVISGIIIACIEVEEK